MSWRTTQQHDPYSGNRPLLHRCRHTRVAARGWLIVTRDSAIIENRNEITAVRENKAKMVALNRKDAANKWGQLEVFMTRWRDIDELTSQPGPFIWRASRTAMTPIPLD